MGVGERLAEMCGLIDMCRPVFVSSFGRYVMEELSEGYVFRAYLQAEL